MNKASCVVPARDVIPGNRVYNSHGYCERAKWVEVIRVEHMRGSVKIVTPVYDTWLHPGESVSIIK